MNGMYLIPANSKKSLLYFGLFTLMDLIIFASGVGLTLILLVTISGQSTLTTVLSLLPVFVAGFLVMPFPHHHNMLTMLKAVYEFYTTRRQFYWRGWCVTREQHDER